EADEREWKFELREPFLSVAVATTPERFFEVAQPGDVHSGFLPRFGVVLPPVGHQDGRELAELTPEIERRRDKLVGDLTGLRQREIRLTIDTEVFKRFNRYQKEIQHEARSAPGRNLVAIIGSRSAWMALRAGILLAVADGSDRMELRHLLRAMQI